METLTIRTRLLSVALGASLLLAACGGGDDGAPTDAASAPAQTVSTVTMTNNQFEPAAPVVGTGSLELVNDGEAPHTFTVDGEDIDIEVEAGETATASIDLDPGTYTLFCQFHRSQGMETTLTVA